MFVREKTVNGYTYLYLVENVRENGRTMARVARRAGPSDPRSGVTVAEVPVDTRGPIRLQMLARGGRYTFAYSAGGKVIVFARDVDGTHLSTATAGGFVGTMIGPFAQGPRGD